MDYFIHFQVLQVNNKKHDQIMKENTKTTRITTK